MFAVRSGNFHFGLLLATALAVSMWSAASRAYTDEQQQACSADAFRLCSADIPDVDRITACMIRNKSQLTPGMPGVFQGVRIHGHAGRGGKAAQHQPGSFAKTCQRQAAQAEEAHKAGRDLIARLAESVGRAKPTGRANARPMINSASAPV